MAIAKAITAPRGSIVKSGMFKDTSEKKVKMDGISIGLGRRAMHGLPAMEERIARIPKTETWRKQLFFRLNSVKAVIKAFKLESKR
mmetsp:Transcript_10279/g.30405  ORF Transcript_10279/g.30405 Transcript_10279/m.30405 type:complete len:86 (-) Transcript_10279:1256-1513(-)